MRVNIICIQKKDELKELTKKYTKLISNYSQIKEFNLFNQKISLAQNISPLEAQKSYEKAFEPYKKNFSIALDERGKNLNSLEFARLLKDKNEINFFIGGAFGLRKEFIDTLDFSLCFSSFTLAHQLVKILLLEQIYRAFCINFNHPYHK
ncbi:23S rRNA (pseudouridine(1915)-N(3))-methyltransferase RlmH [Campylobacter novaezeelandiae]|uniref:23S rRNA (pseudouridine(1915)-N(3))-methyltransferase RlmH n=2 Tax=Campylobacter novaezeelandiae TaxID=2267891 RepID=UPI001905E968|nr:23S rRNA (pseudouridine(1915)-N(3))-methyltransferase RlmH [Campylobacter novaezeelandiae]MBK1963370.1 23S rRNA (pseudouridine(1915)-N(3))-methyltransferase RlmH [Campylobacter novaezeelandiae]